MRFFHPCPCVGLTDKGRSAKNRIAPASDFVAAASLRPSNSNLPGENLSFLSSQVFGVFGVNVGGVEDSEGHEQNLEGDSGVGNIKNNYFRIQANLLVTAR